MTKQKAGWLVAGVAVCGFSIPGLRSQSTEKILLCDGETTVTVPAAAARADRLKAQGIADQLMLAWIGKHPASGWMMPQASRLSVFAMAQQSTQNIPQAKQHEVYNRDSPADEYIRKAELTKFIAEGKRIFHDAEAFGGTVGVSCDMCHPDAANTHPETYPKYQVQMQKVALLRDMINWCIQHPTKGQPLADGDMRLRAMEAYIISQRSGKTIEPGKR